MGSGAGVLPRAQCCHGRRVFGVRWDAVGRVGMRWDALGCVAQLIPHLRLWRAGAEVAGLRDAAS